GGLVVSGIVWFLGGCATAIWAAAALTRPRSRRLDAILVLGVWTVAAAFSFAERTNVYFLATAAVMLVAVVRSIRNRIVFACAVIVLIVMAAPTTRLLTLAAALRSRGSVAGYVRYDALPRAQGGWFEIDNAQRLAAAQSFIDRALAPSDTFFDFANMPILFYLFDRRCPVRQYETPFYETENLQREVISRLE